LTLEVGEGDTMQYTPSRNWLTSFDLRCVNRRELRESPAPDFFDNNPTSQSLCRIRKAAIEKTLEVHSGNRTGAMKQLEIDDRLCNRLLFESYLDEYGEPDCETLTSSQLVELFTSYDREKHGEWLDPFALDKSCCFDRISLEAAELIVESGLNFQLELCRSIESDVAKVLSQHRAGLALGLTSWNKTIARYLGRIKGELHIEDLDLANFPDDDWKTPVEETWFDNLVRKFIRQRTTDYRFVRYLTERQARLLFRSLPTKRLALSSLIASGNFVSCIEKFRGTQIGIFTEECITDTTAIEVHNWNGELIHNARFVETQQEKVYLLEDGTPAETRIDDLWFTLPALYLVNEDLDIDSKCLMKLCAGDSLLFLGRVPALTSSDIAILCSRKNLTFISDFRSEIDPETREILDATATVFVLDSDWGSRPFYTDGC
jgi:hypothetical protein